MGALGGGAGCAMFEFSHVVPQGRFGHGEGHTDDVREPALKGPGETERAIGSGQASRGEQPLEDRGLSANF